MERKYFGKTKVYIHIIEKGRQRESTTSCTLNLSNKGKKLKGTYISTAAMSSGEFEMTIRK